MRHGDVLVRRFGDLGALTQADEQQLRALATENVRTRKARQDLVRVGEPPRSVFLVLTGWACRYKVLEDGRRQILQFVLPGDLSDVFDVVLEKIDHSIGAHTALRYAEIPHERLQELERTSPGLRRSLWWHAMTTVAIQREWTVNIGQRRALERLSHLFCELYVRLQSVGLTEGQGYDLPVTQADLADAVGLTPVHVNRTVQELRERGLIVLANKRLTIPDLPALRQAGLFNPDYLHLRHAPPAPSFDRAPSRMD